MVIDLRFNIYVWFILVTYFIISFKEYSIHCVVNNSIVLLLPVKFPSVLGVVPAVLGKPTFSILITKFSLDLAFFWWIHGDKYETYGLWSILWIIYKNISVLASALTRLGVIILQFGLSSHFPYVTSMVGIHLSRFFIIKFYYTFVNRFFNFHAFKNINSSFKIYRLTIKSLYIKLLNPTVGHTVFKKLFSSVTQNKSLIFSPGNTAKYSLSWTKWSA